MPALPEWDAAEAVAMMDDVGIAAAALSLSSPGVSFLDAPAARARLTRAVNEDGAAAVAAYPDRFGLLASLPLPEISAALAEIGYAFDVLGADGIGLHTHYGPVYLGDAQLDPVMAALDARAALVTIHPASPCGWEQVSFGRPRPMVEFLFDTTRAVVNLALNGVLDRYPAIRWVVPHAGAALPVLADRVDRLAPLISLGPPGAAPVDSSWPSAGCTTTWPARRCRAPSRPCSAWLRRARSCTAATTRSPRRPRSAPSPR